MKARVLGAFAVFAFACSVPPTNPVPDAGEPEEVEYTGESGGNPPDFVNDLIDAGNNSPIDAGEVVFDMRCCLLNFRLDVGDEPSTATARLIGEQAPLSQGIPLTRVDGGYVANACFPMTSSSYYVYTFQYTSDDGGSGGIDQGDGGFIVTTKRHSRYETAYSIAGETQNYIPSVMNCSELDAGQGP